MHPSFPTLSISAIRTSPSQLPPAINKYTRNFPGRTFLPNGMIGPVNGLLRIVFRKVSSHLPGGLGHFPDSNSIPWNQPTIFDPIPIATVQQTFLHLLGALLLQQYRSFRIGEVFRSTSCDSMINLHRILQIPNNCQCK